MASPISSTSPILIIGAGIVGLTLAQALTKSHIPFRIFDRDASPTSRSPGWGITVHWALPALLSCLPPHVAAKLETAQVDPEQGRCDTGQFLVLNLKTAEPVYIIPPAPRMRLSRKKLRGVLMEGVHVEWGKGLEELRMTDEGVEVSFDDGTVIKGAICVGADGASSRTRRKLSPETAQLVQLPVRMIGVTVRLKPEKIDPLRAIDPLLFQGIHPDTGTFLWFSVLSTPEANGSLGADEYYEGQVLVSWKVKSSEEEPPLSSRERVGLMKSLAMSFEERLRTLVYDIPDDTEVIEIRIRDWPYVIWPNHDGKVTLIGDAAHAMTMFRGEAANHGFTDAAQLHDALLPVSRCEMPIKDAVEQFEAQMRARTQDAVLLSRQACLDAYDLVALDSTSPLVSRRAIVQTPGTRSQS